jgi:hypothetical protein
LANASDFFTASGARKGRHNIWEVLMSPLAGLSKRENIIPALFALGHIMTALTGLAGTNTEALAYL